eukprot:SRR837773.9703.p1 GENE.SRR837773.9703~~SRR837773.9703.p1  ORF type:complete len:150 (+),score=71.38 SRR837773.9703:185-634(+)
MTLSPFVFVRGEDIINANGISCFDEASPCIMEQYSQCLIKTSNDQSKYVPWLVCMDSNGETPAQGAKCASQVGVDWSQVESCQKTEGMQLLQELAKHGASKNIQGTPTVLVNDKNVAPGLGDPTYAKIKSALCTADPQLKKCGGSTVVV